MNNKRTSNPDSSAVSRKQLSNAHSIPIEHLKAAKELNCEGEKNNRWKWIEFEPWYKANIVAIQEYLADKEPDESKGEWKQRKERAQALIAEIELKVKQGKTLDKDKVISLVKSISASQSIMLRNIAQELPHRLLGKDLTEIQILLTKSYEDICRLFQKPLSDWTQQSDKESKSNGTMGTNIN
jgi:hypothetical protein